MRILIMGLPGSGKTTLAKRLLPLMMQAAGTVEWFNADKVRAEFDDWDFSLTGRLRQASRLRELADSSSANFVVCDFVAPTEEARSLFGAHFVVWMDSIAHGRFEDTNRIFVAPNNYDVRVTELNAEIVAPFVVNKILLVRASLGSCL